MNSEHFGASLGLTDGKYFRKFIFEFKVEIGIFEMSIRLNFNNFWAFLILGELGLAIGQYLIKIILALN